MPRKIEQETLDAALVRARRLRSDMAWSLLGRIFPWLKSDQSNLNENGSETGEIVSLPTTPPVSLRDAA